MEPAAGCPSGHAEPGTHRGAAVESGKYCRSWGRGHGGLESERRSTNDHRAGSSRVSSFWQGEEKLSMAEKREFPHHMIKEIFEQPQGLHDTIAPRISLPEGVVQLNEVPIRRDELRALQRINIVASGTSRH